MEFGLAYPKNFGEEESRFPGRIFDTFSFEKSRQFLQLL
jgi:hypothetical protein